MKNKLFTHLEYLIVVHNCVAIPGLGSFVLNSQRKAMHHGEGMFVPRGFEISFNAELAHDDGVITSHIARMSNKAYNIASKQVKEASKLIYNDLLNGKAVKCGDLGALYMDSKSEHILFKPNLSYTHPSLYGLSALSMKKLDKLTQIQRKERKKISLKQTVASIAAVAATIALLLAPTSNVKDGDANYTSQANFIKSLTHFNQSEESSRLPIETNENATHYITIGDAVATAEAPSKLRAVKELGFMDAKILEAADKAVIYITTFENKSEAENFLSDFRKANKTSEKVELFVE